VRNPKIVKQIPPIIPINIKNIKFWKRKEAPINKKIIRENSKRAWPKTMKSPVKGFLLLNDL
jgi:hypothetical protein